MISDHCSQCSTLIGIRDLDWPALPVNHEELRAVEDQPGGVTDQEDGDGADEDGGQVVFPADSLAGACQSGVPTNTIRDKSRFLIGPAPTLLRSHWSRASVS